MALANREPRDALSIATRLAAVLALVPISVLIAVLVLIDPGVSSPTSPLYCGRPAAILSAVTLACGSLTLVAILSRKDVRVRSWHVVVIAVGALAGVLLCSLYSSEVSYRSGIPTRSSVFRGFPLGFQERGTEVLYEDAAPFSRLRRLALVADGVFYVHVGVMALSAAKIFSMLARWSRRRHVAARERPVGQDVDIRQPRHAVVPAVHLFLRDGEGILLLRRRGTGFGDGCYSVPAGHVEPGEPATHAMLREAREEIGATIQPEDLAFCSVTYRREGGAERVDLFFTAARWAGEIVNAEPSKCDDLTWRALGELPENMVPYVRAALDAHQNGRTYTEFGWDADPAS